ncbi:MAG: extracellular solute-binding protein [Pseudomonadota bacterium]
MIRSLAAFFCASMMMLTVSACGGGASDDGREVLTLWKHQAGEVEEAANAAAMARFNASQDQYRIESQSLPQGAYSQSIMAASLAGRLPCLLTVDHPMVSSFVWAGHLQPIEPLVEADTLDGVSSAAVGRYNGEVYSAGQFDAALAIFTRRSTLERVGARIPTLDAPWSRDEFDEILNDLKATGNFAYPLDLQTRDVKADWWTYAFSPLLQSFGGDLINRASMTRAEGVLNGPEAIAFGRWFQSLFEEGLVNRFEPDERAFTSGRAAITYTGNWWTPAYAEAFGEDLLILPPPDFGHGAVIGGGSWQWAISSTCENSQGAAAFIDFLMTPEEIAAMSEAAGMIPVTEEAASLTTRFNEDGEWRVFFELMQRFAKERPESPAFATISNAYLRAMQDIMNGKDVRDALDDAVDDIEQVIEDNDGYGRVLLAEEQR